MTTRPRLELFRAWAREPLLRFLLVGFFLFAGYQALHPEVGTPFGSREIVLTDGDLRQLTLSWLAQGRPAPTSAELQDLVEHRVREEILYREALALGLDRGDTIVRRRLAQKMAFLAEDLPAVPEPTSAELRVWFRDNAERFAEPARVSFRHLYYSPDRHGQRARDEAERALARLRGSARSPGAELSPADPFMFEDVFHDRSIARVTSLFGKSFSTTLPHLPTGSWQGPVESGYGWHLVWVDSFEPARIPAFESVEAEVRDAWVAERRDAARQRSFETLRARYRVVVPAIDGSP